ncbi:MAG: TonB-dependent receptor plug domain-containing protein, partial [Pacificimonas sp.]
MTPISKTFSLLLLSSALSIPFATAAIAQTAPTGVTPPTPDVDQSVEPEELETVTPGADNDLDEPAEDVVDISGPGASVDEDDVIVIQGRFIPEPVRASSEVLNVLSAADIARSGEGDIASALERVTGLSLVGGRFVYVRGLGDRYSLALLNGSPLPSPEPLRRVV